MISAIGWRQALVVLAAPVAALALLFALVLRTSPTERRVAENAVSLPRRRFWLLSLSFVAGAIATAPISVLLVPLLIDSGHGAAFAAAVAALVDVGQIPGRLLFGLLAKWLWGPRLPAMIYGSVTASLLVLALDRGTAGTVVFAVLFGLSGGMLALLRATVVADLCGQANYGAVTGAIGAQVSGARALAPFFAAALAIAVGYPVMLLVFACAGVLATIAGTRGAVTSQTAGTATISGTDGRLHPPCNVRVM